MLCISHILHSQKLTKCFWFVCAEQFSLRKLSIWEKEKRIANFIWFLHFLSLWFLPQLLSSWILSQLLSLWFLSESMHVDFVNSWNLQSWSSVALTSWEGLNIFNTCAMPSSVYLHVANHRGHFDSMNLSSWYFSLCFLFCPVCHYILGRGVLWFHACLLHKLAFVCLFVYFVLCLCIKCVFHGGSQVCRLEVCACAWVGGCCVWID